MSYQCYLGVRSLTVLTLMVTGAEAYFHGPCQK